MVLRAYERWSNAEVAELILMLTLHVDFNDMAETLQRSEGAIRSRIEWLYKNGEIRIIDWRIQNGGNEDAN